MVKRTKVTKAELLNQISKKLGRLKPYQRASVMRSLRRQTNAELKRKATHMRVEVDKSGYDISWR
jgi:hypothetical protein